MFAILAMWLAAQCERAAASIEDSQYAIGSLADDLGVGLGELADAAGAASNVPELAFRLSALGLDEGALARLTPTLLRDLDAFGKIEDLAETQLAEPPAVAVAPRAITAPSSPIDARLARRPELSVGLSTLWSLQADRTLH